MFTKTVVFNYTGADQQWVVPLGVTQVFIDVFGAQGGTSVAPGAGGLGGKMRAVLNVTPGETLLLMVGGQPTSRVAVYGMVEMEELIRLMQVIKVWQAVACLECLELLLPWLMQY